MRAEKLTVANMGAACKLFRVRYLNESQVEFAVRHEMNVANLCGFENGYVASLKCFIAYIQDGFLNHLFMIDESDIIKEVDFQKSAREYRLARKAEKINAGN